MRAAERTREDRIAGRVTLDLVAEPEPPLVLKRRKLETVREVRIGDEMA